MSFLPGVLGVFHLSRPAFRASARLFSVSVRISSSAEPMTLERLKGSDEGITLIRLHRAETRNALSKALIAGLRSSVAELRFDKRTRVVIFKSDVPGAFCSGADLKERKTMPEAEVAPLVDSLRQLFNDVSSLPQPVIAAVDGYALGGGLELALACDIRVAATSAKIGLTETRLGIIPGAGGTQRLARAVGVERAKEMIFTARMVDGKEAERRGLVAFSAEDDGGKKTEAAFEKALAIAREIIPRGPIAVRLAKQAINQGSEADLNTGFAIEQHCVAQTIPTKDRLEGLKAFAEKRPPKYIGE